MKYQYSLSLSLLFTLNYLLGIHLNGQSISPYQLLIKRSSSQADMQEDLECLMECFDVQLKEKLSNGTQIWDWSTPGIQKLSPGEMTEIVQQNFPSFKVQPNYLYTLNNLTSSQDTFPNDPLFCEQWNLSNNGQNGCTPNADIGVRDAWNLTTGDSNIVIAVLDGGMDLSHKDLTENLWQNPIDSTINGVDEDNNGKIDDVHGWNFSYETDPSFTNPLGHPYDDTESGHGTHVAGIIGAKGNNGIGIAGVCWNCKILPIKFTDSTGIGSTSTAVNALNYIADLKESGINIKVINNSWGGTSNDPMLYEAIQRLDSSGIIFVAAAGNGNQNNNDEQPYFPASFDLPNIISVAASECHDLLASSSNIGATSVDLAAPGVAILSTLPGNRYGYLSGTSMAAPHVAGALALLMTNLPDASFYEHKFRLIDFTSNVNSLLGTSVSNGRLNLRTSIGPINLTTFQLKLNYQNEQAVGENLEISQNNELYILGEHLSDLIVIKLNSVGELIWARKFGSIQPEHAREIKMSKNGEIIVAGYSNALVNGNNRPFLAKIDSLGELIWSNIYNLNIWIYDIMVLNNGEIWFTGLGQGSGLNRQFSFARVSPDGDILDINNLSTNVAYSIGTSVSSGAILVGTQRNARPSLIISKLDNSGQIEWTSQLGESILEVSQVIADRQEENIFIIAHNFDSGKGNVFKLDMNGGLVWARELIFNAGSPGIILNNIGLTSSGNLVITGNTRLGNQQPVENAFIGQMDPIGNLLWYKLLGNPEGTSYEEFQLSEDNSIFLLGNDEASSTNREIFLQKVDPYANTNCAPPQDRDLLRVNSFGPSINSMQISINSLEATSFDSTLLFSNIGDFIVSSTECISIDSCNLFVQFEQRDPFICVNQETIFLNTSLGGLSYEWTIDDSVVSFEKDLIYQFKNSGERKIDLLVNNNSCQKKFTRTIRIIDLQLPKIPKDTSSLAPSIFIDISSNYLLDFSWKNSSGTTIGSSSGVGISLSDKYYLTYEDICGNINTDSIIVILSGNGQYLIPGDANTDGLINLLDWALIIGENSISGKARTDQSTSAAPVFSEDWEKSLHPHHFIGPGINYKFLDSDGNGIIEAQPDGEISIMNNNSSHPDLKDPNSPYSLRFKLLNDEITLGDTLKFEVILKNNGGQDSLQALLLSIHQNIALSNPPQLDVGNFWDVNGENSLQAQIYDQERGVTDFGFAGINPQVIEEDEVIISGGGIITLIEDIDDIWLFADKFPLIFTPGNALLVGQDSLIPLNGVSVQSTSTVMVNVPKDLLFTRIIDIEACGNQNSTTLKVNFAYKNADTFELWRIEENDTTLVTPDLAIDGDSATKSRIFPLTDKAYSPCDSLQYFVRVRAKNGKTYDSQVWKGIFSTDCDSKPLCVVDNISTKTNIEQFNLYPNPNNGQFILSFSQTRHEPHYIKMTNLLGKEVFNQSVNPSVGKKQLSVDQRGIPGGIYFVSIGNTLGMITKKIIVF